MQAVSQQTPPLGPSLIALCVRCDTQCPRSHPSLGSGLLPLWVVCTEQGRHHRPALGDESLGCAEVSAPVGTTVGGGILSRATEALADSVRSQ